MNATMKAAFSESTKGNLRRQWELFFEFSAKFSLRPLPASVHTICLYMEYLSQRLTPASIQNYISGVKTLHHLRGFPYPQSTPYEIKLMQRGVARIHPHQVKQAAPLTLEALQAIYEVVDMSTVWGKVRWCLYLLTYYSMVRKSNMVPDSVESFDPNKQLTR
jgi:hypothetical protein